MRAHHALVAFRGGTLGDDVAFLCDGGEIDLSVETVADARDEEFELVVGRKGWHCDWQVGGGWS